MIQQILPQLRLPNEALLRQLMAPNMATIDSLLNQLLALKPVAGNRIDGATAGKVIEALVLSSTNLTVNAKNTPQSTAANNQYTITISANQQNYELTSKIPIPVGSRIQLSVGANNLATIINISNPDAANKQGTAFSQSAGANNSQALASVKLPLLTQNTTAEPSKLQQAPSLQLQKQAIIEQGLRQTLPQQLPLKQLLPLLQKLVQQPPAPLPTELKQSMIALLRQIPSAQQMQQGAPLKQAINNSGVFMEAKLVQLLAQAQAAKNPNGQASKTNINALNQSLNSDIKAILQRMLPQVDKASSPNNGSAITAKTAAAPFVSSYPNTTKTSSTRIEAAQPFLASPEIPITTVSSSSPQAGKEPSMDVLLRQLGSQLLASIARSQMHQLESLAARQSNSPDSQGPVNSWTMELPIVHGKNIDNLELRIDQHLVDESNENNADSKAKKIWTVMLAFDLHALGKMNVQLKIIDQSVAATVWSQQQNTHLQVKQQVQELQASLEKVGVKVEKMDCQLGLPPKQTMPIYKQLVDVRT